MNVTILHGKPVDIGIFIVAAIASDGKIKIKKKDGWANDLIQ